MKGINTPGARASKVEASPLVSSKGARYQTLRFLHSLGKVVHSMVPPHSLRLEMRHKNTILVTCFLLCTGLTLLFAAPIAEDTYGKIQSMDLASQSMDTIMQEYDKLYSQVTKIAQNALEDMQKARNEGNLQAYRDAHGRYSSLSRFVLNQQDTDRLLQRILREPVDKRTEYALWLYAKSNYYRPTLSIDFTLSSDGYRYSYTQRLQQKPGTDIVLPDASQVRVDRNRAGILAGWGLQPETVDFEPGQTIAMPLTNQTLYAVWKSAVHFIDTIGNTETKQEQVSAGDEITVPTVTPPDQSYRFVGWYDRSTRTLLDDEVKYTVSGKGAVFEGLWKNLTFDAFNTIYYGFDRLPVKTQIGMGFSISNQGNVTLTGLKASLHTDSPHVSILQDTMVVRDIPASMHRTNNSRYATNTQSTISGEANTFRFVIDAATPSGTEIPFVVTITDSDGESWTSQVIFKVR